MKKSTRVIDSTVISLLVMFAVIIVAMLIFNPSTFYSGMNMRSILYLFPEYGVLTFGMMFCMISGGIDLSLVGIANLCGVVAAWFMVHNGGKEAGVLIIIVAIILALLVGMGCGLFNGFMIGFMKIPAMLVTLCGLELYTGLALAITTGPGITGLPKTYVNIANGTFFGIPYTLPIFVGVTLVVWFILRRTGYGQRVYFLGSNATASRFSGISNLRVTMMTYMISGALGAVSGILSSSHYGSGKSNYNTSYTLLSLLIVVLGGINPNGGKGRVIGVVLAVVLLQFISSAFSVLKINTVINDLVYGAILVVVLIVTNLAGKRRELKNA